MMFSIGSPADPEVTLFLAAHLNNVFDNSKVMFSIESNNVVITFEEDLTEGTIDEISRLCKAYAAGWYWGSMPKKERDKEVVCEELSQEQAAKILGDCDKINYGDVLRRLIEGDNRN